MCKCKRVIDSDKTKWIEKWWTVWISHISRYCCMPVLNEKRRTRNTNYSHPIQSPLIHWTMSHICMLLCYCGMNGTQNKHKRTYKACAAHSIVLSLFHSLARSLARSFILWRYSFNSSHFWHSFAVQSLFWIVLFPFAVQSSILFHLFDISKSVGLFIYHSLLPLA